MSPQPQTTVKEESLDAHMSEDGDATHGQATDNDSPGIHDDNRGFRIGPLFGGGFTGSGAYAFSVPGLPPAAHALAKTSFLFDHDLALNKKKRDPSCCPICGMTISPGDLEAHLGQELEVLCKISGTGLAATRKRRQEPGRPPPRPPHGDSIGSSTGRVTSDADNEGDDVIVDGDEPEESSFGPSQYTESDVVIKNSQDKGSKKEGVQSQVATVNSSGDVEVTMDVIVESDSNVSTSDAEPSSRTQMLEELRNRIRPLTENAGETATSTETEDYKCLICLEHYKKPVISTVCWHVHCEDCWLHALGSKNICPQCSMITAPTDLRRIFM
nr:PREDICTED: E3 ubiquitin-protein ligase RNF220 [Tribolium castaneum]|eukprot:XP_015839254.1 PREDICTED: E3 ubiquitin-protein ligase RNF220 [Tribolium castaneum]